LVRYDLIDAFFSSSSVFLCSTTSRSSRFDFDSSPSSNESRSVVLWCLICCTRALWDTPKKTLCSRALLEQKKQQYHEQQRRSTHIMSVLEITQQRDFWWKSSVSKVSMHCFRP
jgi:hypothetical protein